MSVKSYATVDDITALGISLTAAQLEAAPILLETASSKLRIVADDYGKSIDAMIADETLGDDYANVVKNIVVQAVVRSLSTIGGDSNPAASQLTQSCLGYSATMTYVNAGQSIYYLKNELKELGLMQQICGTLEVYGNGSADQRD